MTLGGVAGLGSARPLAVATAGLWAWRLACPVQALSFDGGDVRGSELSRSGEPGNARPRSFFGEQSMCKSSYVREALQLEGLADVEAQLRGWLLKLDRHLEMFSDRNQTKLNVLCTVRPCRRNRFVTTLLERFQAISPPMGPLCKEPIQTLFDGQSNGTGALLCTIDTTKRDCDIIFAGSKEQTQGDWDLEEAMQRKTSCRIHTFDCLSRDHEQQATVRGIKFYPACLGEKDDPGEENRQLLSWSSALKFAGVHRNQAPEYLRMDLGGFEYQVLRQMLRDGKQLPKQMYLVLHQKVPFSANAGQHTPSLFSTLSWADRTKDTGELFAMLLMLYTAGYRLTSIDGEGKCEDCLALLLSKIYC